MAPWAGFGTDFTSDEITNFKQTLFNKGTQEAIEFLKKNHVLMETFLFKICCYYLALAVQDPEVFEFISINASKSFKSSWSAEKPLN